MPFDFPAVGVTTSAAGSTEGGDMALKPYKTTVNGYETTLMLSDADAKAQGLKVEAEEKQAPAPANKARKAPNKKK